MRTRRRTIVKITGLLMAGAAVNVAVAWGRVIVKGSIGYSTRYFHDPAWGKFVVAIHQSRGYNVVWAADRSGTLLYGSPQWVHRFDGSVWWREASLEPNTNNYAIACGWPMFALTAWRTVQDNDEMNFPGVINCGVALRTPNSQANVEWVPPILALKPIWPGFAINTLFYAAVLWMMFCGPFALRRRLRRRWRGGRGLCPACAYPIGQSPVCTECGAAVQYPGKPRPVVAGRG